MEYYYFGGSSVITDCSIYLYICCPDSSLAKTVNYYESFGFPQGSYVFQISFF